MFRIRKAARDAFRYGETGSRLAKDAVSAGRQDATPEMSP